MTNPNYSLQIISHDSKSDGKTLRKYHVEGVDCVGAKKNEKFEVRFTNHTWQRVQVKISLDGTDLITGEPATTDVGDQKDMWLVQPYGTLSLKAWHETDEGGAALVFTSANNSVALNVRGDLNDRGIIAAAVFTEGHVEPIRTSYVPVPYYVPYYYPKYWWYNTYSPWYNDQTIYGGGTYTINNTTCTNSNDILRGGGTFGANTIQTSSLNASQPVSDTFDYSPANATNTKGLESLAAVGAGEYTEQKVSYVAGLVKPVLAETIRVKYLWWSDLKKKLQQGNVAQAQPSGFPGDKKRGINLGKTPRIGSGKKAAFPREQAVQQQVFSRF